MLIEQRHAMILQMLEEKSSITVADITERLNISEATARRDITALHNEGRLVKVFGGAMAAEGSFISLEPTVEQKSNVNREQKMIIAKYAASLIVPGDFVFIDAGTTTGCMLDCDLPKEATYVTNAVIHARRLAAAGLRVYLTGGELKGTTEAVVGSETVKALQNYNFSKGFFGVNGISAKPGLTTPDASEAAVKKTAMVQCRQSYVLADSGKFGKVTFAAFARIADVRILTDSMPREYRTYNNITSCGIAIP